MTRWLKAGTQIAVSLGLLYAAWRLAGGAALFDRFRAFHGGWAAAAILLTVPQVMLSAERWRLTAERLGADLGYRRAVADYFLAGFVNQVLPTGVMGDVLRAVRHGRRDADAGRAGLGRALRAVAYERASGQAVMLALVLTGAALWPLVMPPAAALGVVIWSALIGGALAVGAVLLMIRRLFPGVFARMKGYGAELFHAVFHRAVAVRQLGLSVMVVASYLAVFYCAGRAIGIELDPAVVGLAVPAVLLSMALPVSVAGWGVRESAAALLWTAAGLGAAEGVAVSVAYGILVLVGSLPGALVLLSGR